LLLKAGQGLDQAEQEAEQQQIKMESEARFEQLDVELAEIQEAHENAQTEYLAKEQQLNDARQRLRELERVAQEAQFAEKSHRSKIEELRRSIATAQEQAAQLFANMQQGHLELESLDDQAAQAGLQALLDRRSDQERALAELFRVMAPHGRLFILINLYKDNPYSLQWVPKLKVPVQVRSAAEYLDLLKKHAFENVEYAQIPDDTPTPDNYQTTSFHSLDDMKAFKRIGALLLMASKPDVRNPAPGYTIY